MKLVSWPSATRLCALKVSVIGLLLVGSVGAQPTTDPNVAQGRQAANNVLDDLGTEISNQYEDSLLETGVNEAGRILTQGNNAVKSVLAGVSNGLQDLNQFLGLNQGQAGGQPPAVVDGGILPGPGSAADGVTYVRELLLPKITNFVVSIVLAGSVIVMMIGGLMYIAGGSDQDMQNKARETIVWAVIGMALTSLAYVLVRIVININFLG